MKGIFYIHGEFEGNVFCDGEVHIGRTGKFVGFVNAQNVTISGCFEGQCDCDALNIYSDAEVIGDVNTNNICIEAGAKFYGHNHNKKDKTFEANISQEIKDKLSNMNSRMIEQSNSNKLSHPSHHVQEVVAK